jgi:hypothetical protein
MSFNSRCPQVEGGVEMHRFEMMEVSRGTQSGGFIEIKPIDSRIEVADLSIVTKGALSILAKTKTRITKKVTDTNP